MPKPVISLEFYFEKSRLYTKDGRLKKIDVANFLKCGIDGMCKMIDIDDHIFWEVRCKRLVSPDESFVDIRIFDELNMVE